jgi:hypothetical protein
MLGLVKKNTLQSSLMADHIS